MSNKGIRMRLRAEDAQAVDKDNGPWTGNVERLSRLIGLIDRVQDAIWKGERDG